MSMIYLICQYSYWISPISVIHRRLMRSVQDHFIFHTLLIMSITSIISHTQTLAIVSLYVMLNIIYIILILISILVCAAASLFCAGLVGVPVSTPLGPIFGSTKDSYTWLFIHEEWMLLKMSRVWRMPPSLPWFFIISLCPCSFSWFCSVVPYSSNISISTLFTLIGVLWCRPYNQHFVFAIYIFRPICLLSSDSSVLYHNAVCNLYVVPVLKNIANKVTKCCVYLHDMCVSGYLHTHASSIPFSCNDVLIVWVCTESNAFS